MTIIVWPDALEPTQVSVNSVSISRSGGKSIGGLERAILTDVGYWSVTMTQIVLASLVQRQLWNAVRSSLRGRSGLIEVPVWSRESAPYAGGVWTPRLVPYDDGATFDDGGLHDNGPGVEIRMHASASIGATVVTLRLVLGSEQLSGIRFSYGGALYETGLALSVEGDLWEVPVFPAIRAVIPSDADLEIERPTCIMHLATDREMDVTFSRSQVDKPTVNFVEAVEYWADMAG